MVTKTIMPGGFARASVLIVALLLIGAMPCLLRRFPIHVSLIKKTAFILKTDDAKPVKRSVQQGQLISMIWKENLK